MRPDAEEFLCRLAREFRPRVEQSADGLLQVVRGELPELLGHEDLEALALEEGVSHVSTFLDVLERRLDVTEVEAPEVALEVGRQLARRGVSISDSLRAYRLGHLLLLQQLQEEAARLSDDWELINAATTRLVSTAFEYVDRASEQIVAVYQEERDLLLQRRLILANEAGKRIGTTLDTVRTAEELAEVGTDGFADAVTVDLLCSVLHEDDGRPGRDASGLRRLAERSALDGLPVFAVGADEVFAYPVGSEPARALATGQALLHHMPAAGAPAPQGPRTPPAPVPDVGSLLLLPLRARGTTLGLTQFFRRRSAPPFDEDDLLLAQEIADRAAVFIDNARRYTHERDTALTLQRSLLPQGTVRQSAVEAASRYLPSGAHAGVGGDWYDVIPLSGARVALVVGDVVGHGIHAAATMGRLRTAVRAFADIDLMPDELLTHLDDVVIRLGREEELHDGETSATCLYAVYDPVSRLCSLASAGHPLPAVAQPSSPGGDGPASRAVDFPDVAAGPPLGLGGFPFETAQFELAEGSLLVLFTDGLVARSGRDVDSSLTVLCDVLGRGPDSPEEVCDRLLDALLPSRPSDDVALLVARTRALDHDHVAVLDLPSDPAAVSGARRFTSGKLAEWGLEELSFSTELVVSELVTNAIRYGRSPVQLRLILQDTLTCEVSDASSTAPHMRRARTFDEGGRGLLLVAQLAGRWGARYHREGKVIWAEQSLPSGA
ncbi:SpoIIE family protein phosphatase [Streptomyces sp. NK15101]|uniref:ATP-binding SpoIIE family protein phosphatase n=1 Tax=Streptomyces sp. NK15101 TaxID=2873261 RepID=UPI001CEC8D98|nr:SpoIIE family protein phosphatase [Streptomyces sp. NK15101]